ncbi:MAG: Rrf2 family transcriptional regulator [Clostridiales Family XIII bacterium]|jgi:Rrf2 family protein|nr:Rrf2 family transcriptional regulator [Clostridiales Family XIII bacterium]
MIITREIDYAVRILRSLRGGELMTTPEICERENLPIHFVYRILKKLDIAGFVTIARGKDGGSRLACNLDEVTFYDLVGALGDRKYISPCVKSGYTCEYRIKHGGVCGVHDQLTQMQDNLDGIMKAKTLSQLIAEDPVNEG